MNNELIGNLKLQFPENFELLTKDQIEHLRKILYLDTGEYECNLCAEILDILHFGKDLQ